MIANLNSKEDIIMSIGRRYERQLSFCTSNLQRKFEAERQTMRIKSARQIRKVKSTMSRARDILRRSQKARAAETLHLEQIAKKRVHVYSAALAAVAADVGDGI